MAAFPLPPIVPQPLFKEGDVFILGAGFSKAIDAVMPTLDELGLRILEPFASTPSYRLLPAPSISAIDDGLIPAGSLEAWLSNLSSPAPFLDRAEQRHNGAIADEILRLIVAEIARSEAHTLTRPVPYWLTRLVSLWDRLGATVITFNYDTLVEQAVNAARMPWVFGVNYESELSGGVTVPILKMHGSINWWWLPNDKLGTSVQPAPLAGRWGEPTAPTSIRGLEHFVIPPVAIKSDYYDLSVTRGDWLAARYAVDAATRIVLLGYSAPVTDLTVASLLSNYGWPETPFVVVDTAPAEVVNRLRKLGLHEAQAFEAADPIPAFVESYEIEASRKVAKPLDARLKGQILAPEDAAIARINDSLSADLPVMEITTKGDTTAIIAVQRQPSEEIWRRALKAPVVLEAIADAAQHDRRLVLRIPGEPDRAVLNVDQRVIYGRYLAIEA